MQRVIGKKNYPKTLSDISKVFLTSFHLQRSMGMTFMYNNVCAPIRDIITIKAGAPVISDLCFQDYMTKRLRKWLGVEGSKQEAGGTEWTEKG